MIETACGLHTKTLCWSNAMESQQIWEQEIIYTHSGYLSQPCLLASTLRVLNWETGLEYLSLWEHGYPTSMKGLPFMKWDGVELLVPWSVLGSDVVNKCHTKQVNLIRASFFEAGFSSFRKCLRLKITWLILSLGIGKDSYAIFYTCNLITVQ